MFELLFNFYQHILDYSKPWPMAQTALITTTSLAASGAVLFLLVRAPRTFMNWFRRQFITSLVFNTAATALYSNYNSEQYAAFLAWFAKNKWFSWSRVITIDGELDQKGTIGPGVGNHFFFYHRRLFVFSIREVQGNASGNSKFTLSISKFGRSKKQLFELMDEFMRRRDVSKEINVFTNQNRDWSWLASLKKRPLETVLVTKSVQEELIDRVVEFIESRQWYEDRGLPFKLTILLYGPPGTGKSSLAAAISSHLNRPLHILTPSGGVNYQSLFQNAKGGTVLIEDVDTYSFSVSRDAAKLNAVEKEKKLREGGEDCVEEPYPKWSDSPSNDDGGFDRSMSEYMNGSLSEFLNGLDGVLRLDDVIVILSTNHPEKLDEALLRDGRVDLRVEIPNLTDREIRQFFASAYPGEKPVSDEPFPDTAGATVQATFMLNKFDPVGYETAIRGNVDNIVELDKIA